MDELRLVTLNVRGLRGKKRYGIYRWLKAMKFDICLLQETYVTNDYIDIVNKGWHGQIFHSTSNSTHSRGVSILIKNNLPYKVISKYTDKEGRMLLLNIEINGTEYTLCNVYAPTILTDRIEFFGKLKQFIQIHAISRNNLLIGGDFNCVDNVADRNSGNLDKSSQALTKLKKDVNLIDIWRFKNPFRIEYTFINPSHNGHDSRIDVWLISNSIGNKTLLSQIIESPAPDHRAVTFRFRIINKPRGKGYWKMNNSVLQDPQFKEGITTLVNGILDKYNEQVSRQILWEYTKIKIKQYTVTYCINKVKTKKHVIKQLEDELNEINHIKENKLTEKVRIERKHIKQKLDRMYEEKTKGYQIRSRAKWVEEGEKSTSYFLNLEKSRQNHNCIYSLKDKNGDSYDSDEDILNIANLFYKDLYKSKASTSDQLHTYFDLLPKQTKLKENEKLLCEGLVSVNECESTLKRMKKNKSPGIDGITTEFYQTFWPLLGKLVVDSFNEGYENGQLTESQRKSVISLIYKKGDKEQISNYRPISLTNVDYRLLAHTLADRLQNVINSVVSTDQSAYIKKRYIGTNIRLVADVIDYFDIFNKSGILMTVDFKKAFDSVEWNFLFKTLHFFNFGPSFVKWIETIYNQPRSCIKNNGHISNYFEVSRGIRQGCPVSALLFILCVEVLGIKIRNTELLKGFNFGYSKLIKIAQYADDSVLFLNNKDEMCAALTILKQFGYISGLIINTEKCEGFWLGSFKARQNACNLFGIKWPQNFRYLGIHMGHMNSCIEKNFDEKIDYVESLLKKWKNRNLSLFGKVQILKTYALSQLTLPATTLCVPKYIVKRLEKIVYTFLWGKVERVKRIKVIQNISEGGLNMVDIQLYINSLSATWISRLQESNPNIDQWAQLPNIFFNSININDIGFLFNFDDSIVFQEVEYLPEFYRQVVKCYNTAFASNKAEFEDTIMDQKLWGNKFITYTKRGKKNVLFLRNWIRSGVRKVKDLNFNDGILDVELVYQKIIFKTNIYCELQLVKKALLPLQNIIKQNNNTSLNQIRPFKSKAIYNILREKLLCNDNSSNVVKYLANFAADEEINNAFITKVIKEKEIKLKEFNFKLLHGILSCNKNLRKWRIRLDDVCDVCHASQSIEHLLYSCTYVKPLWDIINDLLKVNITYKQILGLDKHFKYNFVTTIVSFLIYKQWLLLSLENKKRCDGTLLSFLKSEIALRLEIYKTCKCIDNRNTAFLNKFVQYLSDR